MLRLSVKKSQPVVARGFDFPEAVAVDLVVAAAVVVVVVDDLFVVVVLAPTFVVVVVVAAAAVAVVAQGWSFRAPCDRVNSVTIWPFPWRRLPLSCSFRSYTGSTHQQRSIATAL